MKKKQYNTERIYEEALSLFAKFGYKKTTMDDIAKVLGMTQGNLYLYVKNKRDLYEKSLIHARNKMNEHMVEAFQRETDVVQQIISYAAAGFEYVSKNEDLGLMYRKEKDLPIHSQERAILADIENFFASQRFYRNILIDCLQAGIKERRFRNFNVDIIFDLLSQIYMMFIKRIFVVPEQMSRREMTKEIVNLVLYGIVNNRSVDEKNVTYTGFDDK